MQTTTSSFSNPDSFKVLIYDANQTALNSTKDKVLKSGFYNVLSETNKNESISAVIQQNPQVVITDHRLNDGLDALAYVEVLRGISDVPVVIWGNRLPEKIENTLLSLRKVYTLCSKDGIFTLQDILQRLKLMKKNPGLWA
jgi:CheY-like chemotaxis protein